MSAINEHIKEEFKRFFEYAFRYNPQYWQEISGWEVLGKSAKTLQDTATINRLLSTVVTSEQHLKRIINDSALDSAKELKSTTLICS
jgi:nitrogen regulatory protein PII-like uncharacterized protein